MCLDSSIPSLSMYKAPAFHDEERAAVQGDAETRTWLKWWDPSLKALCTSIFGEAQDFLYNPGHCDQPSSFICQI